RPGRWHPERHRAPAGAAQRPDDSPPARAGGPASQWGGPDPAGGTASHHPPRGEQTDTFAGLESLRRGRGGVQDGDHAFHPDGKDGVTQLDWLGSPLQVALWAQLMLGAVLIRTFGANERLTSRLRRFAPSDRSGWLVTAAAQSAAALIMTLVMAGFQGASLLLGLWIALCVWLLDTGDHLLSKRNLGVEIEIIGLVLLLAGSAWITGRNELVIRHALLVVPWPANHVAVVCLAAGIVIVAADGGTRIV